jgi:hypothetical protein
MANLKRRVEESERQLAQRPGYSIQFDEDPLQSITWHTSMRPSRQPTTMSSQRRFTREEKIAQCSLWAIIPVYLDEHIKRYHAGERRI